jgi:hypothetical protein
MHWGHIMEGNSLLMNSKNIAETTVSEGKLQTHTPQSRMESHKERIELC